MKRSAEKDKEGVPLLHQFEPGNAYSKGKSVTRSITNLIHSFKGGRLMKMSGDELGTAARLFHALPESPLLSL